MPNGISCAFFAGKNLIYGKKENNIFKEGIGTAQTARALDSAAQSRFVNIPNTSGISKVASFAKKIVYPLIIMSGIYNTVKAEDKVKTGINQAGGIGTMFVFEQIAEKGLKSLEKKLLNSSFVQKHPKLSLGIYVAKGLAFVGASLLGYNVGSSVADKSVDKVRDMKKAKQEPVEPNIFYEITAPIIPDDELNQYC